MNHSTNHFQLTTGHPWARLETDDGPCQNRVLNARVRQIQRRDEARRRAFTLVFGRVGIAVRKPRFRTRLPVVQALTDANPASGLRLQAHQSRGTAGKWSCKSIHRREASRGSSAFVRSQSAAVPHKCRALTSAEPQPNDPNT